MISDCSDMQQQRRQGVSSSSIKWSLATSVSFFGLVLSVMFMDEVEEWIRHQIRYQTSLAPDTKFLELWQEPPIVPRLRLFLFNVTNADDFFSGNVPLAVVHEIGPFVYSARQTKKILQHSNDESELTFQSKTTYTFLPEESAMSEEAMVIVPDLLLLTGMLKSDVTQQPSFIKSNIVWPILTSIHDRNTKAFAKMSVRDFFWGQEDELACLDTSRDEVESPFTTSTSDDLDDFFDPPTESPRWQKRNFRQSDGRCIFGAISNLNNTWSTPVRIESGVPTLEDKGRIVSIGSRTTFGFWPKDSSCDLISGSQEPSALAPLARGEDAIKLHIGVACRAITVRKTSNHSSFFDGIESAVFRETDDAFDNRGGCFSGFIQLPPGAQGLDPCTQGSPMAISFPRFLHADQWYQGQVVGVPAPNPDHHGFYVETESQLGTPLAMFIRFQVNLILRPDPDFPPIQGLQSNLTVLPIFWAEEGFGQPDSVSILKLKVALLAPSLTSLGLVALFAISCAVLCFFILQQCRHHESKVTSKNVSSTYRTVPIVISKS